MEHSISSLPKWAQFKITDLERDIVFLKSKLEDQGKAHSLLMTHEWFTIHGPMEENDLYKLFILSNNSAHPICSIYGRDILMIGRVKKGTQDAPKEKDKNSHGESSGNDGNSNGRLAGTRH
jgi:hypothetical protein